MYEEELKKFINPYYKAKDGMHNFFHILRILREAENYSVDKELLTYGAYLHRVIPKHEKAIMQFLKKQGLSKQRTARVTSQQKPF